MEDAGCSFRLSLAFALIALIANMIAFVSPYWLQSPDRVGNKFQRLGLWEVCLQQYFDPEDYVSKLYSGCWWIFWPEYKQIVAWLNPAWFTAVQTLAVFHLLLLFIGAFTLIGMACSCCSSDSTRALLNGVVTMLLATVLGGLEALIFGYGSLDRTWMPRMDYNVLAWGYWLHVGSSFCSLIATAGLFTHWVEQRYGDEKEE